MGRLTNDKGITLIELLVTLTISFSIMGLVSNVLFQSYRSKEMTDTHISFRQDANILLSTLSSVHLSGNSESYEISYKRINDEDWVIMIGDNQILKQNYDIKLELLSGTNSFTIDTANVGLIGTTQTITVNKRIPLNVKRLLLTDKKDKTRNFEISTIIRRL